MNKTIKDIYDIQYYFEFSPDEDNIFKIYEDLNSKFKVWYSLIFSGDELYNFLRLHINERKYYNL